MPIAEAGTEPILSVRNLAVEFATSAGTFRAVNGVTFDVYPGETLGLVGESGSGKTVTAMSALQLIAQPPGRISRGEAMFDGRDLLKLPARQLRRIRGREIGVIFQDPMTYLNPVLTIGNQIGEALRAHDEKLSKRAAAARAAALLRELGVPEADARVRQYPHEFSGGMRQRALIAIATANRPRLLIADEPTTALDVTVQAEILDAIRAVQRDTHAASLFVTHDLGVIAELADRVAVMYAGRIVETADVDTIFYRTRHPYTAALLTSVPQLDRRQSDRLIPIRGLPPSLRNVPTGCPFHPRCPLMQGRAVCSAELPPLREVEPRHYSACHFAEETPALPGARS